MNRKIVDTIFFLICFTLIFNNIPKPLQMNFIGGPVGSKLVFYPLAAGFLYTAYCQWKYRNILQQQGIVIKFCAVYLGVTLVSLVWGLINYPYWQQVLAGPVEQIEKLPKVLAFFQSHGIEPDTKLLMSAWISVRQIKGLFLEIFWCFGGAYMVYCWYKHDYKRGGRIAAAGLLAALVVFVIYGLIDAFYLAGSDLATNILKNVNPLLHPIKSNNGWWPPLLWKNQLRSVFSEPSHVGNYLGLVLPVLLFAYVKKNSRVFLATIGIITFLVVLTNARTAYAMLCGILFLFGLIIILRLREHWRKLLAALAVCCVCFNLGVAFLDYASSSSKNKAQDEVTAQTVLEDNLLSLNSDVKRSNGARYALIRSNWRITLQHPFLGVGRGLAGAYMIDNYTEEEAKNGEIADWVRRSKKYGLFATGQGYSDAMNEFVTRLSQTGVVGLLVLLAPFIWILYKLQENAGTEALIKHMLSLILLSSLVAGCNGSVNLIYGIWIFLGLAYAAIYGDSEEV
ncbi:MAG: O-antigen ligase family protein [Phascolarctobacterium sp.]|uniref:O-antigen ligase family protein n=1 Tax=Phascolarctobacterium sp. TaxID=2049039 RepID=UPI0026DB1513|nr:O-antigen ligase family protein [Phascolarctobacterium sp.]MDO4921929.1 O-antigen ligase family protein [Phascolarctobacterium sp.]